MLKILVACLRLALPARRLEYATVIRNRFVIIFNRIHTINSNNLFNKEEDYDVQGNGKRKRDSSKAAR